MSYTTELHAVLVREKSALRFYFITFATEDYKLSLDFSDFLVKVWELSSLISLLLYGSHIRNVCLAWYLSDIMPKSQVQKCLGMYHSLGLIPHSQALRQKKELWLEYWKKCFVYAEQMVNIPSFLFSPLIFI